MSVDDARTRTCSECGHVGFTPGEFHPHTFCLAKKANPERGPWTDFRNTFFLLTGAMLTERPVHVRDLPIGIGLRGPAPIPASRAMQKGEEGTDAA
jgi:hypothetical protein